MQAMNTIDLTALRVRHKDVFLKPADIRFYLDGWVALQVARRLTDIHDNSEGVRNMLKMVKSTIASGLGDVTSTRYFLTAKVVIDQLMLSFEIKAQEVYHQESPEPFICLWDTAHGMDRALWPIPGVIRELHDETHYREKLQIDPSCHDR
jgi:hypothetical protein